MESIYVGAGSVLIDTIANALENTRDVKFQNVNRDSLWVNSVNANPSASVISKGVKKTQYSQIPVSVSQCQKTKKNANQPNVEQERYSIKDNANASQTKLLVKNHVRSNSVIQEWGLIRGYVNVFRVLLLSPNLVT